MTAHRDLKRIIRERQKKTGESYTSARAHVIRDRAALLGLDADAPATTEPLRVDAVVLKVNQQSARVRILGEERQVTFRSGDVWGVVPIVPGHLVTLVVEKGWTWHDDAYASGRIENPRLDVEKLGLVPLPLEGGQLEDLRSAYEPFRHPDPYAPLWRKLTAKPRACVRDGPDRMGGAAGAGCRREPDMRRGGARRGRRSRRRVRAPHGNVGTDLRCIDAHAHLGNLEFERSPERAIVHYEIGIRIGELSLPPGFDGVLVWGRIYNRPFLRCLHGYGLCLWRLGKFAEAQQVFERLLSLNPNDNQGVRFCWEDVRKGRTWEEMRERDEAADAGRRRTLH